MVVLADPGFWGWLVLSLFLTGWLPGFCWGVGWFFVNDRL